MMNSTICCKIRNMSLLCSFFIVLIHTPKSVNEVKFLSLAYNVLIDIAGCAIPFFFLASGYFVANHCNESQWWIACMKKRLRTLLIPYVLWSVLWAVFIFLTGDAEFHWDSFMGINPFRHPQYTVLWFLRALLFFILLAEVFTLLLRRHLAITLLVSFFVFLTCHGNPHHLPSLRYLIWYAFGGGYMFFFILGMALRLRSVDFQIRRQETILFVLATMTGIGIMRFVTIQELPQCNLIIKKCFVLFALAALWGIVPSRPFYQRLTRNVFALYVVHRFALRTFDIISKTFHVEFCWIAQWLGAIICSLIVIEAGRWLLPRSSALIYGGR